MHGDLTISTDKLDYFLYQNFDQNKVDLLSFFTSKTSEKNANQVFIISNMCRTYNFLHECNSENKRASSQYSTSCIENACTVSQYCTGLFSYYGA